jgi:ABC-type methionine transport system ATPase subunit
VTRLNTLIDEKTSQKVEKIKAAAYPLEGLSVDDAGVIYKGVPLSQLSSGQRLQVSTAIAMALNPKLRVILVRDASLVDAEGIDLITKLAEEKDYQLWIEKMDESGSVGVFIQDGEIKKVN